MLERESMSTGVLVIGSGIAGMLAAIEARKGGAEVILVTKGSLCRESSTAFARSFTAKRGEREEGEKIPGYDLKLGKYIEDWPLVQTVMEEVPKQIENLIQMGVPMVRMSFNSKYKTPDWMPKGSESNHGGAIVLDILATVAKNMGVRTVEGCQIISLLKDDGRIVGASGLLPDGRWLSINAAAVILATGGAAGMSDSTIAPREVTGNGYSMALKAGLSLKNLEFNRFYPVGLPTPAGQYVHCAPMTLMMEKACLRNDKGEDIIGKHFGISLQVGIAINGIKSEWIPWAVALEMEEGKVWLDLTQVSQEEWDRLPERNWKQIRKTQVDMKNTPLPIKAMSMLSTGGLLIDTRMRTPREGLYGAGEVTGGWLDRLRGISPLSSCMAMGAIAGRNAAADIGGKKVPASARAVDEGLEEARLLAVQTGEASPGDVDKEIRRVVFRYAGPVKSKDFLVQGLKELESLEARVAQLHCPAVKDLQAALEVKAMLLAGKAIMKAALLRTESRASFYRRDFPLRDDEHWLRPVIVSYDCGTGEVRAEPGERLVV